MVRIHVAIHRDVDKRHLNGVMLMARGYQGIEWNPEKMELIFSGDRLVDADQAARLFYAHLGHVAYKRIRARIKHRMGRNGHGWPD